MQPLGPPTRSQHHNQPPNPYNGNYGTHFEIFIELLLNRYCRRNVERNVEYVSKEGYRRQIDVQYDSSHHHETYKILVEAKYTGNGSIPFWLREEKEKQGLLLSPLDNLVDEVVERQAFCNGYQTILVTNKIFDKHIHRRTADLNKKMRTKRGTPLIKLVEGTALQQLYRQAGGRVTIDEALRHINPMLFDLQKTTYTL